VAQETSPLPARLRTIVDEADLGDRIGIHVVDATSGREIFASRKDLPLNPASNMKIVTAAGALLTLGPDFTMLTGLYGHVEGNRVQDLVLRGFGDPTLRMSDLVELAEALEDRGVTRVGTVVVDGTYFDDEMLPPAFEQQPGEVASFRAAIAAASIERSSYVLRVIPGASAGADATVRLGCDGYFDLENGITTSEGGAPNVIADQRGDGPQMTLRLSGTVPTGILGVGYRRRVENPIHYAGHCMVEALRRAGITASGRVRIGETPSGTPLITSRTSPPLAEVIHAMGKVSDNFTAEMLIKVLGAERARPGTTARGAEVLGEVLAEAGVPEGRATIVNGSGLFDGNLIAASHLTSILSHVYQTPNVRSEFLACLAVGGRDGTLSRRLRDLPAEGIVRAKTGTLNDVIGLSGYVLGPEPGQAYAFSVLANGIRGRQGAARRLADDLVRALAEDLHR
jgi:D-alanyl-D-alanine carboxypeptidase/D-alanyl-D-alanine-endopeptidase (penicillin-binding protein 4)